jgi:hypothetical protein
VETARLTSGRLTPVEWLTCAIAAIGFAFDTYELLMLPLINRPALVELGGLTPGSPEYLRWLGVFFFLPALVGGTFGLLGGYLTDRLGRRRVLTWSILIYAFSALAAGFATSVYALLFFRCTTFIGVCVEFVAATAWLSELFSEPRRREKVLGWTQAFGSIGGIMVSGAYYLVSTYAESLPAIHGAHAPWRYTLISGVIPAIPLIVIRPFLPESPIWINKKAAGTLKRPNIFELFGPEFQRTTVAATVIFACSFGAAFGAFQHMPQQIVPGLDEIQALSPAERQQAVGQTQTFTELGGLAGRVVAASLATYIVSRRALIRLFQLPGLVVLPLVFFVAPGASLPWAQWGVFASGLLTIGQFTVLGNYIPRVYPTYLRGTGESFAANIGGRFFGTSAALVTTSLATIVPADSFGHRIAYAAGLVGLLTYAVGFAASFWMPEPEEAGLPE